MGQAPPAPVSSGSESSLAAGCPLVGGVKEGGTEAWPTSQVLACLRMPSFLISTTWQSCSGPSQPRVIRVLLVETVWGPPAESGFWGPEMGSRRRRRLTGSHHELLVLGVPAVLHACGGRKGSGRDRGQGRATRPPPPGPARLLPDNPKPTRRARPRARTGAGGAWGGPPSGPAPLALRKGGGGLRQGGRRACASSRLASAWATPGP